LTKHMIFLQQPKATIVCSCEVKYYESVNVIKIDNLSLFTFC